MAVIQLVIQGIEITFIFIFSVKKHASYAKLS